MISELSAVLNWKARSVFEKRTGAKEVVSGRKARVAKGRLLVWLTGRQQRLSRWRGGRVTGSKVDLD